MQMGGPKCGVNFHIVPDLFMDGISVLTDGVVIAKAKACLTKPRTVYDDEEYCEGMVDFMGAQ